MKRLFGISQVKPKRAYPTEQHQLTETMMLDVWSEKTRDGTPAVLWSISRIDSTDESKSFRRLTVDQLSDELPLFVAKVAAAFSGIESLPKSQRESLRQLAIAMADLVQKREMNGEDKPSETGSVLNF